MDPSMSQLTNDLEVAVKFAVERRHLELLMATTRIGWNSKRSYSCSPIDGVEDLNAIEHAIYVGWAEGASWLLGTH